MAKLVVSAKCIEDTLFRDAEVEIFGIGEWNPVQRTFAFYISGPEVPDVQEVCATIYKLSWTFEEVK